MACALVLVLALALERVRNRLSVLERILRTVPFERHNSTKGWPFPSCTQTKPKPLACSKILMICDEHLNESPVEYSNIITSIEVIGVVVNKLRGQFALLKT